MAEEVETPALRAAHCTPVAALFAFPFEGVSPDDVFFLPLGAALGANFPPLSSLLLLLLLLLLLVVEVV